MHTNRDSSNREAWFCHRERSSRSNLLRRSGYCFVAKDAPRNDTCKLLGSILSEVILRSGCTSVSVLISTILVLSNLVAGCTPPATVISPTPSQKSLPIPEMIATFTEDPFLQARLAMVKNTIENRGVKDPNVLRAMRTVPRQLFVPPTQVDFAYEDHPLPIGYGQTISQPYIVAWMTELLDLKHGDKVLEIGTGSGYQAAVLAELGDVEVYSVEIIPELAESATARLKELGYDEVHSKQGDGYYGWKEYAPYDAIVVTAAPDHLPAPLVEQLAENGRIVVPIGPPGFFQTLWKFESKDGELVAYNLGGVAFVPLTGAGAELGSGQPTP